MSLSTPSKFAKPFADSGAKNAIPTPSQISITPGAASLTDGFPPLTRTPIAAGGIPPFGEDMNGILYEITDAVQWEQAGGAYPYDSAFATAVGGYPLGAVVAATDGAGYWITTTANNTTDPEAGGAGWKPLKHAGPTAITMTGSNVTATALQAAKDIIVISGALVADVNLILPTYVKTWTVLNNTTGAHSITVKTASGTGVVVTQGQATAILGDGTDILAQNLQGSASVSSFTGLRGSADGSGYVASYTIAELLVSDGAGHFTRLTNVSVTIDMSLAAGAGGVDTGSPAANTEYWPYVIWNGTGASAVASTNASAPTLPSGYTQYAKIGWFHTGSANAKPLRFVQKGRKIQYDPLAGTNTTSFPVLSSGVQGSNITSNTPTWAAVSLAGVVPDHQYVSKLSLTVNCTSNSAGNQFILSPTNANAGLSTTSTNPPISASNGYGLATFPVEFVPQSNSIYWVSGSASLTLYCVGMELNI